MRYSGKSKGHTLIELLVGCAILSLVLLAVLIIFKNSWSVFRWGEVELDQLRESRIVMNSLYKELRLSEEIYHPRASSFVEEEFIELGNILVFKSINKDIARVIGYKLVNYRLNDKINKHVYDLQKIIYDSGYNPALGAEDTIIVIGEPKVLSSYVTNFNVSLAQNAPYTIKLGIASRHKGQPSFQIMCKMPTKAVISGE